MFTAQIKMSIPIAINISRIGQSRDTVASTRKMEEKALIEDNQGSMLEDDLQVGLSEDTEDGVQKDKQYNKNSLMEDSQNGLLGNQGGLLDDQDGLLVIGAGLPRTGALSLKHALSQLYIGKCYHMMDILRGDQEDIDIWWDAAEGNVTKEKWQTYFSRKYCTTGVDFPFALFYKELMECFPNAKVILSTRDPDSWYSSVHESIFQMTKLLRDPSYSLLLKWMDGRKRCGKEFIDKLDDKIPDGCDVTYYTAISGGPDQAKKFYLDWNEAVKRNVPASRLLVHSADDGWEPLCRFLGFPIPDEPYPRVDDRASIKKATKNLQRLHLILFYILPICIAVIGFLLKGQIISLLSFFIQIVEKLFL